MMMIILGLIVMLLIGMVVLFLVYGQEKSPKTEKKDSPSTEESFATVDLFPNRGGRSLEVDLHPMERAAHLGAKLEQYSQAAFKKIRDGEEGQKFLEKVGPVIALLKAFDPVPVQNLLKSFHPAQNSFFMNLEGEISNIVDDIQQMIQHLAGDPDSLDEIEAKVISFLELYARLKDLIEHWKDYSDKISSQGLDGAMVENNVKILSNEELLDAEVKQFINLYFVLKAFRLCDSFNEIRYKELVSEVHSLLLLLNKGKNRFEIQDSQHMSRIQKKLLGKLRLFYDYYKKYYDGIVLILEKFQESKISLIQDNLSTIRKHIQTIEEEISPMSEGFSSHGGRLEIEYNKAFQRILAGAKDSKDNSSGIPIGQAESLHVFCESRLSDAKSMMNSEPARFTKSMVDQLAENFGVLAR